MRGHNICFMQNVQKLFLITIKYSLLSRAMLFCLQVFIKSLNFLFHFYNFVVGFLSCLMGENKSIERKIQHISK